MKTAFSFSLSLAASLLGASLAYPADTAPAQLKVGVVQMAVAQTVEANRDRTVSGIAQVAPGEGHGWTSRTIRDVTIRRGDEIMVDVRGDDTEAGKLDYVQFNLP